MQRDLYKVLEELEPIIEEMGEKRLEEYCKCYLELKLPKEKFYFEFKDYLNNNKRISIFSFREFLLKKKENELLEIMKKVEYYNSNNN